MTERDYLDDSNTATRVRRRENARARGVGSLIEALRAKQHPNAAYYDAEQILAFERANPDPGGHKSDRIRRRFNCTETRYYQRLYQLTHEDEATARRIDAATVNRLLRLEAAHLAARADRLPRSDQ